MLYKTAQAHQGVGALAAAGLFDLDVAGLIERISCPWTGGRKGA